MLYSKKVPTYKTCSNTKFSPFVEFYKICGESIYNNSDGILRVNYPKIIKLDRYKKVLKCPLCHSPQDKFTSDKCSVCGTYIFSYCSDLDVCTYANPGNARFCEMCGKPTYYSQKKFLEVTEDINEFGFVAESVTVIANLTAGYDHLFCFISKSGLLIQILTYISQCMEYKLFSQDHLVFQ